MATTTSTFEGQNFLQPTGFKVIIDRKRFKNITFFAQSVNHPSVSLGVAEQPFRRTNVFYPGDKLTFGELTVSAIVDENMNVYDEIWDWMKGLVEENSISYSERRITSQDATEYDVKVIILTSANTEMKTITYRNAFPIVIGDLVLNSNVGSVENIILPITFKYSTFSMSD